jgi:hypothetical protein
MTDVRHYQPRCHTCGPLHAPMPLDAAIEACAGHRINHPNHKTSWVRIPSKPVKEHTK